MTKGEISNILRRLRLIYLLDYVRFQLERFRNRKPNAAFKRNHPDVVLPPDYLIYESFQLNYEKYFNESKDSAAWVAGHFARHTSLKGKAVLDWGCGPGRVIRHLPEYFEEGCSFYGTDYNEKSIAWCSEHLKGIRFNHNGIEANLPYADDFFDCIYGISILTHLSEPMHQAWYRELHRILKPGGIMLLTTQGDHFKQKLTDEELQLYNQNKLVVRGHVKEGHRTFSAFQPPVYMRELFRDAEVLEHICRPVIKGRALPQDVWLIKKLK